MPSPITRRRPWRGAGAGRARVAGATGVAALVQAPADGHAVWSRSASPCARSYWQHSDPAPTFVDHDEGSRRQVCLMLTQSG